MYEGWLNESVEPPGLIRWIDERVAKEWGPHAAARVWNIINRGFDGEVEQARNVQPHRLRVTATNVVPGALGRLGGKARLTKLTPEQRREIARKAGLASGQARKRKASEKRKEN